MLCHLDFRVEYSDSMFQLDLFTIWAEEAEIALGAKQGGTVVDIWKCFGKRRVIGKVDVPSLDILDQILFYLPIMKKMGQHVQVEVTSLRRYEDFATDVKTRLQN